MLKPSDGLSAEVKDIVEIAGDRIDDPLARRVVNFFDRIKASGEVPREWDQPKTVASMQVIDVDGKSIGVTLNDRGQVTFYTSAKLYALDERGMRKVVEFFQHQRRPEPEANIRDRWRREDQDS